MPDASPAPRPTPSRPTTCRLGYGAHVALAAGIVHDPGRAPGRPSSARTAREVLAAPSRRRPHGPPQPGTLDVRRPAAPRRGRPGAPDHRGRRPPPDHRGRGRGHGPLPAPGPAGPVPPAADKAAIDAGAGPDGRRRPAPAASSTSCRAGSGSGSWSPRAWPRRPTSSCSTSRSPGSTSCPVTLIEPAVDDETGRRPDGPDLHPRPRRRPAGRGGPSPGRPSGGRRAAGGRAGTDGTSGTPTAADWSPWATTRRPRRPPPRPRPRPPRRAPHRRRGRRGRHHHVTTRRCHARSAAGPMRHLS